MQEHALIPSVISAYMHVDLTVSQRQQPVFILLAEACMKHISSGSTNMQTKHVPPSGSMCKYLPQLHVLECYLHIWHTWKYTSVQLSSRICFAATGSWTVAEFSPVPESVMIEREINAAYFHTACMGWCMQRQRACYIKYSKAHLYHGRLEKTIDRRLLQNVQSIFTHTVAQGCAFLTQYQQGKGHTACFYILKARKRRDGWLDYRRSLGVSEKDLKTMSSY